MLKPKDDLALAKYALVVLLASSVYIMVTRVAGALIEYLVVLSILTALVCLTVYFAGRHERWAWRLSNTALLAAFILVLYYFFEPLTDIVVITIMLGAIGVLTHLACELLYPDDRWPESPDN